MYFFPILSLTYLSFTGSDSDESEYLDPVGLVGQGVGSGKRE